MFANLVTPSFDRIVGTIALAIALLAVMTSLVSLAKSESDRRAGETMTFSARWEPVDEAVRSGAFGPHER